MKVSTTVRIVRRDCTVNAANGMYWVVAADGEFRACGCAKEPIGGFGVEAFERLTGVRLEVGDEIRLALNSMEPE